MERKELIKGVVGGLVFLLVLCLASCSPRVIVEKVIETRIERRDSLVYRDTLIKVSIPLEKDQAIVQLGDTSKLQTTVAESVAYVDSTGRLHHTLENRRGNLSAVVKIPVRYVFQSEVQKQAEIITKEVEVEKPLSWWQNFRIRAFWWLLGAVAALLLWTFRKLLF
jgi:hypothetical protein